MSMKSSNAKSPIVVGPWGGTGGYPWDDSVYSTIRQIVITHGAAVDSIRIEYDLKGNSIWSKTHGSTEEGSDTDKVKLDFPGEILVSVSGYYGSVCGSPVIIRSLTFQSNRSKYGPFGTEDGTPFSLPVSSGKIIGFHGRSGSYLNSIGFYLKQVHVPNPYPASPQSQRLPSAYSRNGYSAAEGGTEHDMVLAVRDRGDSYAVYTSNYPKKQYSHPSPDYNDGALLNKMVSFPSSYRAAMNSPETHGPWGGSGGTIFDDGIYTGVWQINLTRAVGVTSMKVLYDRHGQAVWGNKHGFSGGVSPDKIVFDFPSEVLTHITGFYGPTIIMGPTAIRSLTFHTNKRRYGPYGDEYGTYFSTSFTNGRIVGFHGREGWYIDGIGVHVQEGKVGASERASRPATGMSPSRHYDMLARAPSDIDDDVTDKFLSMSCSLQHGERARPDGTGAVGRGGRPAMGRRRVHRRAADLRHKSRIHRLDTDPVRPGRPVGVVDEARDQRPHHPQGEAGQPAGGADVRARLLQHRQGGRAAGAEVDHLHQQPGQVRAVRGRGGRVLLVAGDGGGEGGGVPRPERAAPGRHRRAHAALAWGPARRPQVRPLQVPLLKL